MSVYSAAGERALQGESTVISIPGVPGGGPRKDAIWCRVLCVFPHHVFPHCTLPHCIFPPLQAWYRGGQAGKGEVVQSYAAGLHSGRGTALGVKMSFLGALDWSR